MVGQYLKISNSSWISREVELEASEHGFSNVFGTPRWDEIEP